MNLDVSHDHNFITIDPVVNREASDSAASAPPPRRTTAGRRHSSTRERVLRTIELRHGATSVELAEATELHENTVRGHLDQLRRDGHVRREPAPRVGRGRPAWRWVAVAPEEASPYAGLAAALADALSTHLPDPAARAREAGVAWGRRLGAERAGRAVGAARSMVTDVMREQGFAPEDDGVTILLHRCPLLAAAAQRTDVVCAVHEGLIEGIARTSDAAAESSLSPFAVDGACALHLRNAS